MREDDRHQPEKQVQVTLGQLEQYHVQLNDLYEQNINLRMKYPTEPMRFYQSEEQIDNILQSLQVLAQEHIPLIVQSKLLTAILKLLNHPNEDINISCIEFLHELISEEPQKDQIFEVYYRMCVWLVDNGIYDSLVETLGKMNQEESVEEYEVSLQILKIIQTLTEQVETSIEGLVGQTKLLQYLSNRVMPNYLVKHKVIDDNKFVGSDLLALLLSNSQEAQLKFHTLCGMQILLESIRPYLSKNPGSSDEQEFLGNLFDCLNILLINPSEELLKSKIIYHQMKGNQIMLQFLKIKTDSSPSALKAISNSFTNINNINQDMQMHIIEELIDFGALKYFFPIIMRQGIRGKDVDEQMVIDENCLKVVLIMISSTSQIYRMRVEAKLTEKRFVKLQKLFEIRNQYMQNIGKEALKIAGAEEYYSRLKDGLGVVDIVDRILCTLAVSTSTVRQKLVVLMKLYGVSADDVEYIIKTKYTYLGEGSDKNSLQRLLSQNLPLLRQMAIAEQPQSKD